MAAEWLKSANDDLALIKEIIDKDNFTNIAAFHSQQAVEKTLKALLEYHNSSIPRKHDLLFLKESVRDFIEITNDDILDTLNKLYIDSRYPGDLGLMPEGKPRIEDIEKFYNYAAELYQQIQKMII